MWRWNCFIIKKTLLNLHRTSILFKYVFPYLETSIGDLKYKMKTVFISPKKTPSLGCTPYSELQVIRKRISTLRFCDSTLKVWIPEFLMTEESLLPISLAPVELLIQRVWEVSRTKPLQLWSDSCSQKGLPRVCCIESTTHTSSLFILPA